MTAAMLRYKAAWMAIAPAVTNADHVMMIKTLLLFFLALSLATQGATIYIQIDNDHALTALVNTNRDVHVKNNDFDDDQRGAKPHAAALLTLPFRQRAAAKSTRKNTRAPFSATHRPLFKLKTAFLI